MNRMIQQFIAVFIKCNHPHGWFHRDCLSFHCWACPHHYHPPSMPIGHYHLRLYKTHHQFHPFRYDLDVVHRHNYFPIVIYPVIMMGNRSAIGMLMWWMVPVVLLGRYRSVWRDHNIGAVYIFNPMVGKRIGFGRPHHIRVKYRCPTTTMYHSIFGTMISYHTIPVSMVDYLWHSIVLRKIIGNKLWRIWSTIIFESMQWVVACTMPIHPTGWTMNWVIRYPLWSNTYSISPLKINVKMIILQKNYGVPTKRGRSPSIMVHPMSRIMYRIIP